MFASPIPRPVRRRYTRHLVVAAAALILFLAVAIAAPAIVSRMFATASAGGSASEVIRSVVDDAPGVADGVIGSARVTVFDDVPAITGLRPELRDALQRAAHAAADDSGTTFTVNSGWRSPRYQQQLLDDAVAQYGSREEAARWVATPTTSAHVTGDAIDLGPWAALDWLSQHGAAYGLCQVYANEPWHWELRTDAPNEGCPAQYPDPTSDPRMTSVTG